MNELVRMISDDGTLYVLCVNSTEMVQHAQNIHSLSKVCSAALGRLITGASMMGILLKGKDDTLTLKMSGSGPASPIVAVANSDGYVKGYVGDAHVKFPLNSVGGLGVLVNPDDEQVLLAGGFLIQLLPTADDETITKVENGLKGIKSVTAMLSDGLTPEEICKKVLPEFNMELLDRSNVEYKCDCSLERVTNALIAAGKDGLREMAEDPETEVVCHFCNKKYIFTSDQV